MNFQDTQTELHGIPFNSTNNYLDITGFCTLKDIEMIKLMQ